jgi:hypothetical protein
MAWVHHINEGKADPKRYLFYHRWFIHFGKKDNKEISIEICSNPNFGWGLDIEGGESRVLIYFWFIWKFYIGFNSIFPEWIFAKEYNQFSDRDPKPNENKKLKGRARTRERGWIRTATRETSITFHNYMMWWNIWRDDNSWDNKVPKWRNGSFHPGRWIRGKDKVTSEVIDTFYAQIKMPEGRYQAEVEEIQYIKKYPRWFSKKWKRFDFKFGYHDHHGTWIDTPVLHHGKGSASYNCGMDGTYSMSLSSDVKDRAEAVAKVLVSCLKDRKKYGEIEFPKNMEGIVDGIITKNLINEFA